MTPWLSLLIPAYEYPEGVLRIFDFIELSETCGIEDIVADDSESNVIASVVKSHPLYLAGKVSYYRNRPRLGAVGNWNSLLERAVGDYILFMHHDECPENIDFFNRLKFMVEESNGLDVLFLRCSHLGPKRSSVYYYMPYLITVTVLRFAPEFLFLRNLIGSPSNVLVRRNMSMPFDERLQWLVDVEWYVRLLKHCRIQWSMGRDLSIISEYNPSTSITRSIGPEIPRILVQEAQLIESKIGRSTVMSFLVPDTLPRKVIAGLERILWLFLRGINLVIRYSTMRTTPRWLIKLDK